MRLKLLVTFFLATTFLLQSTVRAEEPIPWEAGVRQGELYLSDGETWRSVREMLEVYDANKWQTTYVAAYKTFFKENLKNAKKLFKFYDYLVHHDAFAFGSTTIYQRVVTFADNVLAGRRMNGEVLRVISGGPILPHDVRIGLLARVLVLVRGQAEWSPAGRTFLTTLLMLVDPTLLDAKTHGVAIVDRLLEWYKGASSRSLEDLPKDLRLQSIPRDRLLQRPGSLILLAYFMEYVGRDEAAGLLSCYYDPTNNLVDQTAMEDVVVFVEHLADERLTTLKPGDGELFEKTFNVSFSKAVVRELPAEIWTSYKMAEHRFKVLVGGRTRADVDLVTREIIKANAKKVGRRVR